MHPSERYWYSQQLEELKAKTRVHGVDTSKEQRHYLKLLEGRSTMSEAALKVVDPKAPSNKVEKPKVEKAPKVSKPKAEKKPRTAAGFAFTAKVYLQTDKDGKHYGRENNPKRVNSNAHKLFSHYRNEMTIGDFIAAGGTASAIKYDIEHGYIKVA